MLWRNRRRTGNVEDRRGSGGFVAGRIGTIIAIIVWLLGGNPLEFLGGEQLKKL